MRTELRDAVRHKAAVIDGWFFTGDIATIEMETSTQPVANVSMEAKKLDAVSN